MEQRDNTDMPVSRRQDRAQTSDERGATAVFVALESDRDTATTVAHRDHSSRPDAEERIRPQRRSTAATGAHRAGVEPVHRGNGRAPRSPAPRRWRPDPPPDPATPNPTARPRRLLRRCRGLASRRRVCPKSTRLREQKCSTRRIGCRFAIPNGSSRVSSSSNAVSISVGETCSSYSMVRTSSEDSQRRVAACCQLDRSRSRSLRAMLMPIA